MMVGGPPGGGFGPPGGQAGGLPFAGVPPELQARVDGLLEKEPEHAVPSVTLSHADWDRRPFTLRRFLGTHRVALVGAAVLVALEAVAAQAGPLLTRRAIDDGISQGDRDVVVTMALLFVATIVLATVVGAVRTAWTGRVGERLLYDLRVRTFSHLQRLSLDYYTEEKAGRVLTRMTSDVDALQQLFQEGLVNLAVQGLTVGLVTGLLFLLDWRLALVTVVAVLPAMLALTIWFRARSDTAYAEVRERIAEVLAHLSESLSGVRVMAAFNRRRHDVMVHRAVVGRYRDANVRTAEVGSVYGPATDLVGGLGTVVVIGVGGWMVIEGHMTVGTLTAFILYLAAFFLPIQQLVQLYTAYQSGKAAVNKLAELLATEPSVLETPGAPALPPVEGRIELVDVRFSYVEGTELFPGGVSLTIAPGETLALVGPTGGGKSTLARLVARLYDPTGGTVLVDGVDVRTVTLASLRGQLGVVPQEPFLFAGTLRDNIAFARPDATDAEVLAAAAAVGLGDLVERLPNGLETR
jgi:ATP-binding cassette, subfamily B, bacterial